MTHLLLLACFSLGAADTPPSAITVDARRQLFLDDYLIESMSNVERRIHPARKHPANPVLWPRESWEDKVAVTYGSVIRDGKLFRMWYKTRESINYAESEDGLNWTRPRLDLVKVDGRGTNILARYKPRESEANQFPYIFEIFGVHKDEADPNPARRYKMGFLSIDWKYSGPREDPFHKGQRRGLGVAVSPDGLRWTVVTNWATEAICDGATHWMFDPARNKYVLYGRTKKTLPEVKDAWSGYDWYEQYHSGRAVARVESADFLNWDYSDPATAPVVLTADAQDTPGTEIYSMKVFPYGAQYIGLVQTFHAVPGDCTLDVQLAVSRDTLNFTRVGDRSAFIPVGPVGSWDRFNNSLSNNDPIVVGDELWFYYGGRTYRHDPYKGPDKGPNGGGIGVATIQRDRFVSLQASFDGGEIVTRPLELKGRRLHLNCDSDFGRISVQMLDMDGKLLASSSPITQDSLDAVVRWKDGANPQPAGPVRLKIRLENALLFALWSE